ncbi:MAG: DUF4330 family protein [Clostridia bacterium]|nr:DUF4330 family protein [Clostridia bacterium]
MKIIKDKKLFGKLNIVDVILIIVILILIVGVVYKLSDKEIAVSKNNQVFNYTVKVQNVRPTSADILKVGDIVYEKVSGTQIGKVINIVSNVAQTDMEMYNGNIEKKEIDGRIDMLIEIQTDGIINNNEYLANGLIRILYGSNLQMQTKYLDCTGVIINIKAMEE